MNIPTLCVHPQGDDGASGAAWAPLASLAQAVARCRQLLAQTPLPPGLPGQPPRTRARILLAPGDYFDVHVQLTDADSGLAIEASPDPQGAPQSGARPVLHGGRPITGWYRLDQELWAADLPADSNRAWDFRMLSVAGCFAPRARYPQEGYLQHETDFPVRWMSSTAGGWERKPTAQELTTLCYRAGDLGLWLDINNAELTIYHSWDESLVALAHHDLAQRRLTFANPAGHPAGAFANHKYVLWNLREGLTQPGQWFLDRSQRRLVYWPLPGQQMDGLQVIAPTTDCVLDARGSDDKPITDLILRGLKIAVATTAMTAGGFGAGNFGGALEFQHAANCLLEDLEVACVGGQAVKLQKCQYLTVYWCHLHHCGAGAVHAEGQALTVSDCHVHHNGLTYPSALGVRLHGSNNLISHNEIHDTSYSAVTAAGGRGTRIENNLFHDVMQVMDDGAAVYVTFCQQFVIRGNLTRDVRSGVAHAYYVDEQGEDCVVEDNVALHVAWPLHNHMARRGLIRRNLCLNDGPMKITFARCADFRLEHNILLCQQDLQVHEPAGGIAALAGNLFFSRQGELLWKSLQDYRPAAAAPIPAGVVQADPEITVHPDGTYHFSATSCAPALGLTPTAAGSAPASGSDSASPTSRPGPRPRCPQAAHQPCPAPWPNASAHNT